MARRLSACMSAAGSGGGGSLARPRIDERRPEPLPGPSRVTRRALIYSCLSDWRPIFSGRCQWLNIKSANISGPIATDLAAAADTADSNSNSNLDSDSESDSGAAETDSSAPAGVGGHYRRRRRGR